MKAIPQKLQPWIEARKRFHLSHAQVQMGRELGLNPRKFRKYANREQEQWKQPLPQYIEYLYFKRFGKRQPDAMLLIEKAPSPQPQAKAARHSRKHDWRAADRKTKFHSRPSKDAAISRGDSGESFGARNPMRKTNRGKIRSEEQNHSNENQ